MESIIGFIMEIAIAFPVVMLVPMIIFPLWWIEYMDRECLNRLNKVNKKLSDKLNSAKNTEKQEEIQG